MLKVHLANHEPNRIGGGWSFQDNFAKGVQTYSYDESDIYFVTSPTIAERDQVVKAKDDGKKIVLRVDNAVRNSNNRNTGMSRMKDFADMADLVIYQSEWAKSFLLPFTKKNGPVILNGVDLQIFKPPRVFSWDYESKYLYVRSSRDEGKQWIMAWYYFVNSDKKLDIVGKFSGETAAYNFDFYNNEDFNFLGHQPRENMPDIYRRNKYFLYTYLNDCCSNTLLEARATKMKIVNVYGMLKTGGANEIMKCEDISLERMCNQYSKALNELV